MKRINLSKVLIAVLSCVTVASCDKGGETAIIGDDGMIRIAVEGKAVPAVKGGVMTPVVMDSGDTTLTMWLTSAPMKDVNDGIAASQVMTKGARITSANITDKRNNDISLSVYSEDTLYIKDPNPCKLAFDKWAEENKVSYWNFSDGTKYLWPKTKIKFFAWSPSTVTLGQSTVIAPTLDPATGVMTLDYTMPTDNAANQPDLLFACESFDINPADNLVHLHFEHMLSALHFEIGKTNDMTVKEIKIENLFSKGKLTYDAEAKTTTTWSDLTELKTFKQTYTADIHEDLA